jgi:hypothetical protein
MIAALTATALAVLGIPHGRAYWPKTGKARITPWVSGGPPVGPAGSRVSAMRHGVML